MQRVNPQLIVCILASSGCAWINGAELDARQDMDGDGYIALQFGGTDCDDTNDTIFPGAEETWYDTINQSCKVGSDFDQDGDGLTSYHISGTDCDDEDADIGSGATWWRDEDNDQFGSPEQTTEACSRPFGYAANDLDCDDQDVQIHPDATEWCDSIDNNCDGVTDEPEAADAQTWYEDADGDGFGVTETTLLACEAPLGFVALPGDCNDALETTHPDATEICNDGEDNDCDGTPNQCGLSAINNLSSSRQVAFRGDGLLDGFGFNVSGLGNLDGQGGDEFVISGKSINGDDDGRGALFIFWAANNSDDLLYGLDHEYSASSAWGIQFLASEAELTLIGGELDRLGKRIVPLGDVNADGLDDFAVSAPGASFSRGEVYVYTGSATREIKNVSTITGANALERGGSGVALAGDATKDGHADLWVGSADAGVSFSSGGVSDTSGTGAVYLVPGPFNQDMNLRDMDLTIEGSDGGEEAGRNIVGNCDFNADGEADLFISAKTGTADGGSGSGIIYLFFGDFSMNGTLEVDDADLSFLGAGVGASAGEALACADMNTDGYDDMVTSSPRLNLGVGAVFIQMGAVEGHYGMGHSLYNADWTLEGTEQGQNVGGQIIAGLNVNGDTDSTGTPIPDLVVSTKGRGGGAEALLVHGPFSDYGSTYDWYSATAVFYETRNKFGLVLGSVGDVNADGLDDLVFGNPSYSVSINKAEYQGIAYLQLGEGL